MMSNPYRTYEPVPLNLSLNWLHVLGTAEVSQIYQRVCHQLHALVSLRQVFKPQQQPLARICPGKGPFDTHPQRMDGCVEAYVPPTERRSTGVLRPMAAFL